MEKAVCARLLGSFAIYLGDKCAGPWPRASAKRLLALVLLSPKRHISRGVASDTLFRDLAPPAASNALYNAISSARKVLGDLSATAATVLGADRAEIYISPAVEVDLELHVKALHGALGLQPGLDRDDALVRALSEDGILLEDELYSDWSMPHRESLELIRQDARVALARDRSMGYGRSGFDRVIQAWEAVFSRDPASEEAASALIGTFALQGQRQLAVRTYDRCRAGLQELGLEPSSALESAYGRAKNDAERPASPVSSEAPMLPSNLPAPLSSFIGREPEQSELSTLVCSSALVTITRPGGSGKTRLAIEVAAGLVADGQVSASFVELASITDEEQVPSAVAAALGVREQASRPLNEVLADALSGQDLLVVIDNCEHVIDAAADLAAMLNRKCHRLRLLATSREPLEVEGEHVYRLGPCRCHRGKPVASRTSKALTPYSSSPSAPAAHDPAFCLDDASAGLVALVCRRLDGIPLAIELAAARLTSMSLAHLEERLDHRFSLLTGGPRTALPRQRTLQATIDWSFGLLSALEQTVLGRLSVFSGTFELEAAEAVCSTEAVTSHDVAALLGSLVNKSLVVAERSSGSLRYSMQETIRQYGTERLLASGGEADLRATRAAHALFYLGMSERAAPELRGRDQGRWLRRLDFDWGNLRAALGFFLAEPDRTREVLRMGSALVLLFLDPLPAIWHGSCSYCPRPPRRGAPSR